MINIHLPPTKTLCSVLTGTSAGAEDDRLDDDTALPPRPGHLHPSVRLPYQLQPQVPHWLPSFARRRATTVLTAQQSPDSFPPMCNVHNGACHLPRLSGFLSRTRRKSLRTLIRQYHPSFTLKRSNTGEDTTLSCIAILTACPATNFTSHTISKHHVQEQMSQRENQTNMKCRLFGIENNAREYGVR